MTPKELLGKLRKHLIENKSNYVEHHSWLGDTEGGFYSEDEFSIGKLCDEIDNFEKMLEEMDEFSAKLKAENRK